MRVPSGPPSPLRFREPDETAGLRSFIFERLSDIAAVLDDTGVIVDVNDAWRLFGLLNDGEFGGTGTGTDYLAVCDRAAAAGSDDAALAGAGLRAILAGHQDRFDMTLACHSPTEDRWFRMSASAAPVTNGAGLVVFFDAVGPDEADDCTGGADVHRLLGPLDRRRAAEAVAAQLGRSKGSGDEVTVLCVALDGLAAITAEYGRAVGDHLLNQIGSRVGRAIRHGDRVLVAVDDLLVVCPALACEDGRAMARRLTESLASPYQHGALELVIGVTTGVATSSAASTGASLLDAADAALAADPSTAPRHTGRHRRNRLHTRMAPMPTRGPEVEAQAGRPHDEEAELRAVRAMTEAIITHSSELVILCQADGTIEWASPAASTFFGVSPEQLVGLNGYTFVHPDDLPGMLRDLRSIPNLRDHVTTEFRVVFPDGRVSWLEETATNLLDEPDVGVLVCNLRDVTARHESEETARFRASLLEAVGQAIVATDLNRVVTYWNDAAEATFGWSAHEALGTSVEELIAAGDGNEAAVGQEAEDRWIATEPWTGELRVRIKDGTTIPILATNSIVRDSGGVPIATISVSSDITERHETQVALAHQASHDPLTNLRNRSSFDEHLNAQLRSARGSQLRVAVAVLDLDRFKALNDTLGQTTGDQTIQAVATRLQSDLRPTDEVFRFDGDEFILLRPGVPSDDEATALGLDAARALAKPLTVGGHLVELTASIGVAYSTDTDTAESLLRDAGTAMSQAKADGRAQVVAFDAHGRARALRRLTVETGLHHALELDQLHLAFQPVLEIATQQIVGFEALLRWDHPELGPVGPDEFIPVAETSGLILPIGDWVLQQSLEQLAAWTALPGVSDDLTMAINLSARQLGQPGMADRVTRSIARTGVCADSVHLEITESVFVDQVANAVDTIDALRSAGVRISMDDFGTGYSSLSYLNRLPIHTLKIDRSFVIGLGGDGNDSSIVRAIVALADSLDLDVVAEGVETEQQRAIIENLGARYGQGYLWSKPLRPDDALAWMASRAVT